MGLYENFPYSNYHELNLNWVLSVAESAKEHLDGYDEDMAQIAADTQTAADAAAAAAADAATVNTKVGQATTAANNAAASATSASGSATIATNKANAAAASANAAAGSASDAHSDALAAAGSASDAHDDALAAAGSASDAHDEALAAAASASDAASSVQNIDIIKSAAFCNLYCLQFTDTITVLKDRTVTTRTGNVYTLDAPGLVAFRLPFPNDGTYNGAFTANIDGSNYNLWTNAFDPDDWQFVVGYADVAAANLHYILVPYETVGTRNVAEEIGGKKYTVIFARAYNLSTGAWLADNTGILGANLYLTSSRLLQSGAPMNGAAIGTED